VKQAENEARKRIVEDEPRQRAKKQMMVLMQAGHGWQEAARLSGVRTSRSSAYRWFHEFRKCGEAACHLGRHGHPAKMRAPLLQWLEGWCRAHPQAPSSLLQKELQEHFGVVISITHLNRLRAALGLARQAVERKKKHLPSLSS
jgi:transposase